MADTPTTVVWAPQPSRVAALLWAQIRDGQTIGAEGGVLVDVPVSGELSDTSQPTLVQVQGVIGQAVGDVQGMLAGHEPCTKALRAGLTAAVAYRAAALLQPALMQRSSGADETTWAALWTLWKDMGPALIAQIQSVCPVVRDPDDPGDDDINLGGQLLPVASPARCRVDWARVGW